MTLDILIELLLLLLDPLNYLFHYNFGGNSAFVQQIIWSDLCKGKAIKTLFLNYDERRFTDERRLGLYRIRFEPLLHVFGSPELYFPRNERVKFMGKQHHEVLLLI